MMGDDDNLPELTRADLELLDDPPATIAEGGALDGPRPSGDAVDAELKEIDELRRTNRRKYFKDQSIQERERQLLSMRRGHSVPMTLMEEWASQGGEQFHLEQARSVAKAALADVPDAEGFQAGFDALPEGAQEVIFRELALVPEVPARLATKEELDKFATTPEGKELVEEWGRKADRKLALLRNRVTRIWESLVTPEDIEGVDKWLNGLSSEQAKAVYRALVA